MILGLLGLVLTAESELLIEKATKKSAAAGGRPNTGVSTKDLEVSNQLPKLLTALEEEHDFAEDRYQGQVCVGWLHWVIGEYNLAAARLPKMDDLDTAQSESPEGISDWTRVCALKSAYLRANCLARSGQKADALLVFEEGLPCLTTAHANHESRKQLRYWSELFLTEFCMLFSHTLEQGEVSLGDANSLASFRSWAKYWEGPKGTPLVGGYGFRGSVPRRRVWFEYYSALSTVLEDDLPFPTGYVANISNASSARSQLRMELKKVEAAYESLLLSETEFPKAEEEREEVEAFVNVVMQNWAVLKGRGWRDMDLGLGGKESLSRGVLDILYRASMKTYHSTSILRHLFKVHLSVADFDLAFKAFDSYLSLIKKGEARVAKTGHDEPSLDDDATVLETVSLCIAALCRYGDRQAAEKARDLSLELEQIVSKLSKPPQDLEGRASPRLADTLALVNQDDDFPPRVIALGWQSVGLAHAQWARVTYDSVARADIQAKAVKCLKRSLSPEFGRTANLRGVFALGLLLAEQRELGAAIDLVKAALLANNTTDDKQDLFNGPFWKERSLIPLWHLLALLLSARQDYVMAARACEGAFEQFKDPSVLFGSENLYRSDHLNEAESDNEKTPEMGRGVVDEMDDFEKESILEVKMTQLALVELLEGPKVAVNASLELLSLYTRLFGSLASKPISVKSPEIPKSSAGTLRSIKGSIFGRASTRSGRNATKHASLMATEKTSSLQSRPQTMQTVTSMKAPAIQVTKENGSVEEKRHSRRSSGPQHRRSMSGKRNSLRKRDSSGSRRRAVSSGGAPQSTTVVDGESYFTPLSDGFQGVDFFNAGKRPTTNGPPVSMSRQVSGADSFLTPRPKVLELGEIAHDGIEPTSSLMPLIQFSKDHENRRRLSILIKVWLLVSGFYRRAGMPDDAKASVGEAQKLVQLLETDVAKDTSGAVSLRNPGWAGRRSVDELWADVWAEAGGLASLECVIGKLTQTQLGYLSLAKDAPYAARSDFESALTHFPDHPAAVVGLSGILLDIYNEKLLPPPAVPELTLPEPSASTPRASTSDVGVSRTESTHVRDRSPLPAEPLGLRSAKPTPYPGKTSIFTEDGPVLKPGSDLPPPYKATSLPLVDRLAARDRAYGLLSGLTKLGSSWNDSEAWFALARAHEESGQPDKAKEVLWWCVELEETRGVRDWHSVGTGGYVL
jgi:cargo-transport protein YPP1